MTDIAKITALSNGARFYRADLHIHSHGGSHDVKDGQMTPDAIVKTAVAEKLDIIAVTDHNEITNVDATVEAAKNTGIAVIPGVELSTPEGHLLCYLPTIDALKKFHGRLTISDRNKQTSHCQNAMLDCLKILDELSGFAILAHVDGDAGFETVAGKGNTPHKLNILCHPALLGIELKSAASGISYSDSDTESLRVAAGAERIKRLSFGPRQFLARLLNSDAHSLKALGRNANGDQKVTRVKMERPSFEALRLALMESDARVRIEEHVPNLVPHVVGICVDGGFIDGLSVHFSPNLNCIIGGRGTGKSTAFQAVRCLIGDGEQAEVVDSEAWPQNLSLFWQDQAGARHVLERAHSDAVCNVSDPKHGPTEFQIECYGQGETAHISEEAKTNPIALLSYLNRFVDVSASIEDENNARDELLSIQTEIDKAAANAEKIPSYERDLLTTQQQLTTLEKENAKDIIALQRNLEDERAVRAEILTKLSEIKEELGLLDPSEKLDEISNLADASKLSVGGDEFKDIIAKGKTFQSATQAAKSSASASFETFKKTTEANLASWKLKESKAQKTIDDKRKELEAKNIRLDMGYIQKLAKDEARLNTDLKNLRTWIPHLKKLKKQFDDVSKRRWEARARTVSARLGYAKQASETLQSVLADLTVTLKFLPSSHAPAAEEQITAAMNWRTNQVPRAGMLIRELTLPGLIIAIDGKDAKKIASVKTPEGVAIFSATEAARIIENLGQPKVRFALERAEAFDLPKLTVTRMVDGENGKRRPVIRDFTKLSLGQQQSVLLALMLSSKSNAPLIIDQPEDNLDAEFIYKSLVPVLRLAKERRQIIVVTHNANIAVLGDAEQLIVLKSTNDKGSIVANGSIDDPKTRDVACDVLEGAKEAFKRRAQIYGLV